MFFFFYQVCITAICVSIDLDQSEERSWLHIKEPIVATIDRSDARPLHQLKLQRPEDPGCRTGDGCSAC